MLVAQGGADGARIVGAQRGEETIEQRGVLHLAQREVRPRIGRRWGSDHGVGDDVGERIASDADLAADAIGRCGEQHGAVHDELAAGRIDVADRAGAAQRGRALVEQVPTGGDALELGRGEHHVRTGAPFVVAADLVVGGEHGAVGDEIALSRAHGHTEVHVVRDGRADVVGVGAGFREHVRARDVGRGFAFAHRGKPGGEVGDRSSIVRCVGARHGASVVAGVSVSPSERESAAAIRRVCGLRCGVATRRRSPERRAWWRS